MAITIKSPSGQAFDLSVTSGGVTRRQANTAGSAKGAQTLAINVSRSNTQIAPEVVRFEAVPTNGLFDEPASGEDWDATTHLAQYEWDFGDPGSQHVSSDLTAKQRDANRAYGKYVAHYYASPGTYTVTCTITWPGTSYDPVVQTAEVVIAATESAFATGDINYIDPDSDYTDAPAEARTFNDIDTFMSNYDSGTYTTPQLVYFARGKTLSWDTQHAMGGSDRPTVYMMTDPNNAGAKAIVTTTLTFPGNNLIQFQGTTDSDNSRDFALHDIDFRGPWDSETETGNIIGVYNQTTSGGPDYVQCTACNFDGWYRAVTCDPARDFAIANNTITNWQDYGIYINSTSVGAVIGNDIKQSANALSGGPKDGSDHNNHGPIRHVAGSRLIMIGNHLHSGNGWVSNIPGFFSPQSCARLFQNGDTSARNIGARSNISDNIFEGGGFEPQLAFSSQGSGFDGCPMNVVMERNIFVPMFFTKHCIQILHGGVTVRNNLFALPNVQTFFDNGSLRFATAITYEDPVNANALLKQQIYGNSIINLMSSANHDSPDTAIQSGLSSNFPDFYVGENLLHQPNLDTPDTPYTNIDSTALFTPRYSGYRSRWLRYTSTFEAENGGSVSNGGSFTIPYSSINGSLTQADIDESPSNPTRVNHELTGDTLYGTGSNLNVSFAFNASEVTITNNTGGTLSGTFTLHLLTDNDSFIETLTETATPADTVWSGRPLAGSTIADTGSAMDGWDDFNETRRRAAHAVGAQEI